jgi:hypothetical protein
MTATMTAMSPRTRRGYPDAERMIRLTGQIIADLREERGWTQTELGHRVDPSLDQKTVSRIELGEFGTFGTGSRSRPVGLPIGMLLAFDKVFGLPAMHIAQMAGWFTLEVSAESGILADEGLPEPVKDALLGAVTAAKKASRRQ